MKTKSLLGALLLALPLFVAAAPNDSILLLGQFARIENGRTIFAGSVSVIFKDSTAQIDVSADEIVFEQEAGTNRLKCAGNVVIRSAGRTTKGQEITIELGAMSGNIYLLNPNGITLSPSGPVPGASPEKQSNFERWAAKHLAEPLPTFDSRPVLLPRQR